MRQGYSAEAPRACSVLGRGGHKCRNAASSVTSKSGQGVVRGPPIVKAADDWLGMVSRWPDEQRVNVFLSFSTDDHGSASLFDQEMSTAFGKLQLLGQPWTSMYERDWQSRCNEKLQGCAFLICLIGETTYRSTAVAWEIGRTLELAKPVLPILLHEHTERLPPVLRGNSISPYTGEDFWTHSNIFSRILELNK